MSRSDDRTGDLAERLQSIADDLDELIFDRLREHITDGDKQLTQARRAVEKAVHLLRDIDSR
ncbi:MAG TPA: hypothetical protein VNQ73_22870 [Ilumatobacter sp.]|nr:hypothetical protein [Ilumatobacter sp.]